MVYLLLPCHEPNGPVQLEDGHVQYTHHSFVLLCSDIEAFRDCPPVSRES